MATRTNEDDWPTKQSRTFVQTQCMWGGVDRGGCSDYIGKTALVCSSHAALERWMDKQIVTGTVVVTQ